jgi:hypothetical protein
MRSARETTRNTTAAAQSDVLSDGALITAQHEAAVVVPSHKPAIFPIPEWLDSAALSCTGRADCGSYSMEHRDVLLLSEDAAATPAGGSIRAFLLLSWPRQFCNSLLNIMKEGARLEGVNYCRDCKFKQAG